MATKKKYYAVKVGKTIGIFNSWNECKEQVEGYPGCKFKSFPTLEEAREYVYGEAQGKPIHENKQKVEVKNPPKQVVPKKDGYAKNGTYKPSIVAYVSGSAEKDEKRQYIGSGLVLACGDHIKQEGREYFYSLEETSFGLIGELKAVVRACQIALELGLKDIEIHHHLKGVAMWATGEWQATKPATLEFAEEMKPYVERLDIHFVYHTELTEKLNIAKSIARQSITLGVW